MQIEYGILKSNINTGSSDELKVVFSAPLSVISNQPSYVQDSLSLKRKASRQLAQRWEIETRLMPENNGSNFATHSVLNGHDRIFFVRMPQLYGISSTYDNRMVAQACPTNSEVLEISGAALAEGEFISFDNHTKVYMVVNVGIGNITISPGLLVPVLANTPIVNGERVVMVARYDDATKLGVTYIDGVLSDPGTVKLVEAI